MFAVCPGRAAFVLQVWRWGHLPTPHARIKPMLSSFGQQKAYPHLPAWIKGGCSCYFWSFIAMPRSMHVLVVPFPSPHTVPPFQTLYAVGPTCPASSQILSTPGSFTYTATFPERPNTNTQHFFLNHSFPRPAPTPALTKMQRLARCRVAFLEFLGRT